MGNELHTLSLGTAGLIKCEISHAKGKQNKYKLHPWNIFVKTNLLSVVERIGKGSKVAVYPFSTKYGDLFTTAAVFCGGGGRIFLHGAGRAVPGHTEGLRRRIPVS